MNLSVIIPTRNEEGFVARAIQSAWDCGATEVIVADGGSTDETTRVATHNGARVVETPPGRGTQMNGGAHGATGDVLLFLHADNWLSPECKNQLDLAWEAGHQFCCFQQQIDGKSFVYRLIEKGNAIRARFQKLPYGDQGFCVSRAVFERVNGFDEIPLMEDVGFAKKVFTIARLHLLAGPIYVSQRRWKQNGPIRQTIANWLTMLKYRLGVCPQKLAQAYYRDIHPEESSGIPEVEKTGVLKSSDSSPLSLK